MLATRFIKPLLRSQIVPTTGVTSPYTTSYHHRTMSIVRLGTEDPRSSKIVIHNGIVYISGQVDATSTDIAGQTKNTLAKVDDLLTQAGTTKSNLLTASIWLKDINRDFTRMNEVWNEWLDKDNKPVRATVEANLARESLLVEVQVTAAVDAK